MRTVLLMIACSVLAACVNPPVNVAPGSKITLDPQKTYVLVSRVNASKSDFWFCGYQDLPLEVERSNPGLVDSTCNGRPVMNLSFGEYVGSRTWAPGRDVSETPRIEFSAAGTRFALFEALPGKFYHYVTYTNWGRPGVAHYWQVRAGETVGIYLKPGQINYVGAATLSDGSIVLSAGDQEVARTQLVSAIGADAVGRVVSSEPKKILATCDIEKTSLLLLRAGGARCRYAEAPSN